MGFFKTCEIRDAQEIYGFSHQGVFAKEPIKKGESIFRCDLSLCDYLQIEDWDSAKTREETLEMFEKYPESRDFMHKYCYMVEDDLFDWPRNYIEQTISEGCMYFNHSCDPNCGFLAIDTSLVVAIRDIEPGEELTYDYQCMDTEASFYAGLNCKCGSFKCRGVLSFDFYRNLDWQKAYYKYSSANVQRKIDELKTKWYTSRCILKYYKTDDNNRELGLTVFKKIRKDDLVASFSDKNNICRDAHNIRHSDQPTCYLVDNEVFASNTYEPNTELTLNYNLI
ncbi:unnamed protein product [Brachionus calyciflorus]|uniref:SET domain-containing protein n=1 Tax=Brachionus calyciflorus TaxID=104777 RepID=A0A814CMB9_9BILA|nr:unnamed protein product [Brachionus calyciflorus]